MRQLYSSLLVALGLLVSLPTIAQSSDNPYLSQYQKELDQAQNAAYQQLQQKLQAEFPKKRSTEEGVPNVGTPNNGRAPINQPPSQQRNPRSIILGSRKILGKNRQSIILGHKPLPVHPLEQQRSRRLSTNACN